MCQRAPATNDLWRSEYAKFKHDMDYNIPECGIVTTGGS